MKLELKMKFSNFYKVLALIFTATLLIQCSNVEKVDRSYVNTPIMDLRNPSPLGKSSPKTSLRSWGSDTGSSTCSVCSH